MQTTPELPQSKLAGKGVRMRGRGRGRGPGRDRRSNLLFGDSEMKERPSQHGGDGSECIAKKELDGEEPAEQHGCGGWCTCSCSVCLALQVRV